MSLAVPAALAFGLVALPIIVFYILKVRLRQVPVSTNMFWNQIFDEKPPRSIWQRFRHLLSLLAQLLLLALMVFALADPIFSWQANKARRVVLVIDNSASMQATDVEPSRFEAATKRAIELADGLRFRDQMAIVLAGSRPDVVLGMSGHVPTLKEAIRSIKVSDNPTGLNSAIDLGRQLIGDHPNGEVIVLTDGCGNNIAQATTQNQPTTEAKPATHLQGGSATESPGRERSETLTADNDASEKEPTDNESSDEQPNEEQIASTPPLPPRERSSSQGEGDLSEADDVKISWQVFATEAPNVGITKFQVRRSLIDMLGYEVLASVKNASETTIKARLEIALADSVVDVIPLELKPGELWSRSLEKTSRQGGILAATLTQVRSADDEGDESPEETDANDSEKRDDLNSLTADDNAWAILPEQKVQNVLIVTEGNLFLRKVFEANPLVNVTTVTEIPEEWPKETLVVLHRMIPKNLPSGDVFVVDPFEDCDQWTIGDTIDNPIVTEIDKTSELMTHVRLDNVVLPEARKIEFKTEPKILAGTISQDVVYAQLKRPGGKCLLLSVDLDKSDLAFRTTFPIMVTNALNWFVESSGDLRESSSTGDFVTWTVDAKELADKSLILQDPNENDTTVANDLSDSTSEQQGTITLGPFETTGVWALGQRDATESESVDDTAIELVTNFAVNIASERETDLRPDEEMLERSTETTARSNWFGKPVWYYLIFTAAVLFVVEWLLHQRRVLS
jgi:hypothetical protein